MGIVTNGTGRCSRRLLHSIAEVAVLRYPGPIWPHLAHADMADGALSSPMAAQIAASAHVRMRACWPLAWLEDVVRVQGLGAATAWASPARGRQDVGTSSQW